MRRAAAGGSAGCRAVGADRVRGGRQHRHGARPRLPRQRHLSHLLRLRRPVPRRQPGPAGADRPASAAPPGNRSFGLLDARRRHRLRPGPPDRLRRRHHRRRLLRPRRRGRQHRRRLRLVRHARPRRRARSGPAGPTSRVGAGWQYRRRRRRRRTPGSCCRRRHRRRVVDAGGSATIAGFTAEHGDGPGYLLAGLGCDGEEFSIDALRFGSPGAVTTYDLEGITVHDASIDPTLARPRWRAGDRGHADRGGRRRHRRTGRRPDGPRRPRPAGRRGLPAVGDAGRRGDTTARSAGASSPEETTDLPLVPPRPRATPTTASPPRSPSSVELRGCRTEPPAAPSPAESRCRLQRGRRRRRRRRSRTRPRCPALPTPAPSEPPAASPAQEPTLGRRAQRGRPPSPPRPDDDRADRPTPGDATDATP